MVLPPPLFPPTLPCCEDGAAAAPLRCVKVLLDVGGTTTGKLLIALADLGKKTNMIFFCWTIRTYIIHTWTSQGTC